MSPPILQFLFSSFSFCPLIGSRSQHRYHTLCLCFGLNGCAKLGHLRRTGNRPFAIPSQSLRGILPILPPAPKRSGDSHPFKVSEISARLGTDAGLRSRVMLC